MNTTIKLSVLVLIIGVLCVVQCCYWDADNPKRIICEAPSEVRVEGNNTWTNLKVYDEDKLIYLRKNTFRRTPRLTFLVISYFSGIEKGTLSELSSLDELEFYDYRADEFPVGILDNLKIRKLTMNDFGITHILPGTFNHLPELGILSMYRSKITEIKAGVFTDTTILKIYMDDSLINKIEPNAFANMEELLHLSFSGNKLTSFNSEEIFGAPSDTVNRVWLDRNKIKQIEKSSFSALPLLTKLNLDLNDIEFIEDGAFEKCTKLDFLDLSNNKITEIQPEIFPTSGLTKLTVLHLHNNKLSYLHPDVFERFPVLEFISFGANPLQCPCSDIIYNWLTEKNIQRLCDNEYDSGNRPSCIFSTNNSKSCQYEKNVTLELYQTYKEVTKDYSIIPLHCDTTGGTSEAFLEPYS